MAKTKKKIVPFSQVLETLQDIQRPFPAVHLHRFSDLAGTDLAKFKNIWPNVDANRRASFLEDLEELAESDTVVSFDELARFALSDAEPRVRETALHLLWECEDKRLIPTYLSMMEKDTDPMVRASAASALGLFVYKGELEEIPPEMLARIEDRLLVVEKDGDEAIVRRRALEALGYSSRPEVPGLIREAYRSADKEWQASALFAMGRSADETWEKDILNRLNAQEPEVELEAVKAAGHLELQSARELLLAKLDHYNELDEEVRLSVAWSLSQIGGENVREVLEKLAEEIQDDEEVDYIEMAVENLAFTEDLPGFGMFDPIASIKEGARIVDLSELEGDEEGEDDLSDALDTQAQN
jgi:HEAT repeat protein